MKKKMLIVLVIVLGVLSATFTGCENVKRSIKDTKSEFTGLNRIATVYDQNGNVIKQYEGKFDVEVNEYGNKVKFDVNGKRVLIYNATVIVEEKQ